MVSLGDRTISENQWRLKKAANLVKLLALAPGHRLHREQLMDALWPYLGRAAASNNLRRTLHAARQVLEPTPATSGRYLLREGEDLVLCTGERAWVDVEAFENAASAARRRRGEPAAYRLAVELYAGDLLPSDLYEDWAEERRRQLRQTFLSVLIELAELHEVRGEYSAAVEVLRRAVAEEPTREETHEALIRAHALSDDVEDALAQYGRLEVVLSQELGARPGESSRLLRDEIATGRFPPGEPEATTHDDQKAMETSDSRKHNLPASRTSFVGREQEVREIKRGLSMTRLLTLTGAGGSGKTRLALEVARDLVGAYSDGVWLVELAPLSEGPLVPRAVATVLRVQERAAQPLVDTLVEVSRNRDLLLLLDNCEHLVEAAASLADALLESCAKLRILATSREPLGVAGEVRWTVPALSTPDVGRTPVGQLEIYESVRLFAERARHRESSFALTTSNARPVAEICERLDGIPLAVELAAARVGTLGLSEISGMLGDSLRLLTAGGRTAAPRQRTLRGTLDWGHDLLSKSEKSLFRGLSVFAGGWTLDAAESVCSGEGIGQREVLDLLSALVNKSLVVTEASGAGELRYRFLEPVHQYARERLEASGEGENFRRRHAAFYLALAEEAEPRLRGPDQAAWIQRLDAELDNLRTALAWLPEHGEAERGLRLGSALLFFWTWRGSHQEGSNWLEEGLRRGDAVAGAIRAKALNSLADIKIMLGDYERSHALLQEGLWLYRAAGDAEGIAACLCDLGWLATFQGDFPRAKSLLEESLVWARESKDTLRTAFVLNRLAGVAGANLDREAAEKLLLESLALYRHAGDSKSIAMCLGMLGYLALRQGNHERAVSQTEEAMARIRAAELSMDAFYPTVLALAVMLQGDLDRAKHLIAEALLLGRTSGNRLHTIQAVEMGAILATARQDPATAARLWGAAEANREILGAPRDPDDEDFYEPHIARGRAGLSPGVWTAAWEEGHAMTQEEAVDHVLSENSAPSPASTLPASEQASDPQPVLSRRERQVADLVSRGLTNRHIASELYISERTAENHVARILKKLGLRSREQVSDHLEDV